MNKEDVINLYETKVPDSWKEYFDKSDIDVVENNLIKDLDKGKILYPKNIFRFLEYFRPHETKVIISGQDPYHDGSALGYSFGIKDTKNINVSLRNIFSELESSYDIIDKDYSLEKWAKQGILLLNKSLTVEKSKPNSHKYLWLSVTRKFIERLSKKKNIIFMLWGNDAKELSLYIHDGNYILESSHPSFFSANKGKNSFIGCNHFKICNRILAKNSIKEISW